MAIEIREMGGAVLSKTVATFDTFAEAKAYVEGLGVICMEDDPDGYVDCADAFLKDGRVVAIQPVGFKL